ncbi:MAG TPA: tripartite tricarboxylate transporter substrate binding protein [Xanthobacteraceae bacterium]|nr:tripartite tricarboxylate transporter substrate binding protein [Xanthobacteraceae bacterium]
MRVMKAGAIVVVGVLATLGLLATSAPSQAENWPTHPVKFIVPFGPGAGADIGARLFAEKLQAKWGQPVVIENRPGGDSIVAIQAFLGANDDHVLLFGPAGNFTVHPFNYTKLPYNPADLIPIVRVSNTILALAVKQDTPYKSMKEFTEAARAAPGKFNAGLVQGITEFTFWGYEHEEKLDIVQVPYKDINVAPTDLGEGRIQVVMSSYAIVQPQIQAGRIRPLIVNNKTRAPAFPNIPTARESGYPSLEVEGLVGLFGLKTMSNELKEKIAADFKAVTADGVIGDRLRATAQAINIGGPKEFADAIDEQRAKIAATVKAINFKPKN